MQKHGLFQVESYEQEIKNDSVLQGLVKGEISGFFKNIVEFNRESIKGTFVEEKLDEMKNRH
jgi:hypothetical protein